MPVPAEIVTDRLTLVPLTLADLNPIYDIAREKQSIEDFQYVAHSLDDVKAWLVPSYHDPTVLNWTIRQEARIIGLFEVCFEAEYSDLETNVCRIGYFLDWKEHNHGYATEALHSVVTWLFDHTDVVRIEAGVTLHNAASYRILEKAGFVRDKIVKGNWQWYDQVYDSVYYFLTKRLST